MVKTVLVTGAAGFIAKHTIEILNRNKFNVVGIDRKQQPSNFVGKYYQMDVTNSMLENVFKENNIDFVIHLSALPSVGESIKNPQKDCMDNYFATVNVCTFAKKYGIKKIVFSSTAAVYANPQYLPVDEKHPTTFLSPYAITKNASENFIKYCGIDYIIFRYANVYGEGQDCQGEAGVIAKFFDLMQHNDSVYIHGTGEQYRDFVSVNDVANVNVLALQANVTNEIINVSTNTKTSINELFNVLQQELNYTKQPIYTESRAGDIEKSILSNKKLISLLNYAPSIKIDEGIKEMIKSVQNDKLTLGGRYE